MTIEYIMSSLAFTFDIIFSCILTLVFLYRCGNHRRQHPITTIAVFIAWLFSILIVFILPLDISLAAYQDCLSHLPATVKPGINGSTPSVPIQDECPRPWSYVNPEVYKTLWRIVYWTSQVLTWLILPFMQSICETGEFTLKGKIRYAIKANLIFYGSLLIIFIILIIYVATKVSINSSNFTATIVAASTTWGLFLLVLMLGYGLVEVPLNIYNHSRTGHILARTQFKLSKIYNEKIEVEERLDSDIDDVTKFCMEIKTSDPMRPHLDQIIKHVPENYLNRIKLTVEDYDNNRIVVKNRFNSVEVESQLVKLHERLKKDVHVHHRVQVLWLRTIDEAFFLEDIFNSEKDANHEFTRRNPYPPSWLRRQLFDGYPKFEWFVLCFVRPWALRFLGVLLGLVSIIVIWSEMTFFSTKPVLSIFAQCVNAARDHYSYFTMEVFCCLSIAYLCLCAYYTMFRIRVLDYFYLSFYHLTDENSLIFAATFLCRLTAPLCYNFLGMIHLDQAITNKTDREETLFTLIMGHLTAIPIISIGFNLYFPMLILLLSIGTYFRLGSRCLHACGFEQFFDDDEVSFENVEYGKDLMNKERRDYGGVNELANTTTAEQRRERRREYEEKYGIRSAATNSATRHGRSDAVNSETRPLRSSVDEPLLNSRSNTSIRSDSSHQANPTTNTYTDI